MDHYLDKKDEDAKGPSQGPGQSLVLEEDEAKGDGKTVNVNATPYLKNQKTALSKEFGTNYSICMIVFLIMNSVVVLFSHLGSSLLVRSSLDDSEDVLEGACTNPDDEAVLAPDSDALLETSSYLKGYFELCGDNPVCIEDFAVEEFGFTLDCSTCLSGYALCLDEFCNTECYTDPVDDELCTSCSNFNCEFGFEVCAGLENFIQDKTEDCCNNENDLVVFAPESEALVNITTYLPQIGIICNQKPDLSESVCIKQEMFAKFDISEDCATCSFQLLKCIERSCIGSCFGPVQPNPACEGCLLTNGCAAEYDQCTGLDAFGTQENPTSLRSLQTIDLCNNEADLAILTEGSEVRTNTSIYLAEIAVACAADQTPQCVSDGVADRFSLSDSCASCSGDYAFCLFTSACNPNCIGGAADPAACDECANNFGCEFAFELCSGVNYIEDSDVDACINDVDSNVFVSGSVALTEFDSYVPLALNRCSGDLKCMQAVYLEDFDITEDCSNCLVDLSICMAQSCREQCFGPNLPLPGCEDCLDTSGCADSLQSCSGIDFLNPPVLTPSPTEQGTSNLCDNEGDSAILLPGSEALTQTATYLPELSLECAEEENEDPECVADKVAARFGLSQACASCSGSYTTCLKEAPCSEDCFGETANPVACEECANNFRCEFDFEVCSGVNYVLDKNTEACINEVDNAIFVEGSDALDDVDLYIPEILRSCGQNEICIRQLLFDRFGITDDCSLCLTGLSGCMSRNCFSDCFGPDLPLETCEPCLVTSPCGGELLECSGIQFVETAAPTSAPTETPPLVFSEDGSCLDKDQFQVFDTKDITFFFAVERTIDGGLFGVALILITASGIWPYMKNILMAYAWFGNLTQRRRDIILRTLAVLGKWSFLDVFAVILLVDGLTLQFILTRSGLPFVIFAEPRDGILWFAIAAIWALAQGEVIRYFEKTHLKQRNIADGGSIVANLDEKDQNIAYYKIVLGIAAGTSLVCSFLGIFLLNLKMTVLGKIVNNEGPTGSEFNIFELASGLADNCAIHDEHTSPTVAVMLAAFLVLLVVVIPIVTCLLMMIVAFTFHPNRRDNFFIGFSFGLGNFACLDVWFIALFVFSNQFQGIIEGSLGENANNCPITQDEINSGIICVGLKGETSSGGFFLGAAAVSFWVAQYASVKLMQNSFKFVGTYVEYDNSN